MYHPHRVDKLLFGLLGADYIEVHQKMIGYSNQGIFWPSAKPVHCTAGYQTRKLQGPVAELFSNLWNEKYFQQNISQNIQFTGFYNSLNTVKPV